MKEPGKGGEGLCARRRGRTDVLIKDSELDQRASHDQGNVLQILENLIFHYCSDFPTTAQKGLAAAAGKRP